MRTVVSVDDAVQISVSGTMGNAAVLTLAGLCLGTALTGLLTVMVRRGSLRERLSLGLVYVAFLGLIALPLVRTFAEEALVNYMPLLLVLLLALPPAFFHYVAAKTTASSRGHVPWRDLALPLMGAVVCIGFWSLPAQAKKMMFISGELPAGVLPATLALLTFVLILIWLIASFAYLVAMLRRLTAYRAHIRQLYSDVEERDLRWINLVMVLLVLIWAAGAFSLASENLADGSVFREELLLALIACGLLVLNIFTPFTPANGGSAANKEEPDLKYARSALTSDHAAKLAARVEKAMQKDKLYLDPNLSLQRLSRHVGAQPNQVSQTLNQKIGTSFFDYVARWRIEAAKPLITAADVSVLTVAMDVGFNSRSAFYKAFKRETGMTPQGYRTSRQNLG